MSRPHQKPSNITLFLIFALFFSAAQSQITKTFLKTEEKKLAKKKKKRDNNSLNGARTNKHRKKLFHHAEVVFL